MYAAGVRHFVVARPVPLPGADADVLIVASPLRAMQALAAHHRAQFSLPVVGITGSNGKTIVKEWLSALLTPDMELLRSPGSYNSQTGVALSVWQLRDRYRLAIFEAGISRPGEMEHLEGMIRPDIGIFTNIGPAHREGFASQTEKIQEKMRLFGHCRLLICCSDHEKVAPHALEWAQSQSGRSLLTWSRTGKPASVQLLEETPLADMGTRLKIQFDIHLPGFPEVTGVYDWNLPFVDTASIENALHSAIACSVLGVSPADIGKRLTHLEPVAMRLELKAGIRRCIVVNDAYNNDPASLRLALAFAGRQMPNRPLTLILSDILQSGQAPRQLYEKVAHILIEHRVQRLIGIGRDIPILGEILPAPVEKLFFEETDRFLEQYPFDSLHDECIVLKGARVFAFERIAARLEQKAHKTVLEIDLSALAHNFQVYRQLLSPGVKTMAMVKAAGYGGGSAETAKLLEFHRADYLGVAYTDEGIELREAGVNLPILVLNPESASLDALFRYRLEPEIYSPALLSEVAGYARLRNERLAVHLKLDTGMHRLGFEAQQLDLLTDYLHAYGHLLQVQSVFTHLSASDAPAHDAFTHEQAARFLRMYERIAAALAYRPLRHVCNTAAISRFPEYHFDMVRMGVGLYGVGTPEVQERLRTVSTLRATISQIKDVPAGDSVGYNRNSGVLLQPRRIATISIGYADGLLRLAGNGRYAVQVRGQLAPTIGNVCMDMTMIDVSDIPTAREGDMVVVFGEQPSIQSLALTLQTIPYEVLTNVSQRVKRVYLQE